MDRLFGYHSLLEMMNDMTIGDVKQEHFTRPKEDYDSLLLVARRAKVIFDAFPPLWRILPNLAEALKEVEHLL